MQWIDNCLYWLRARYRLFQAKRVSRRQFKQFLAGAHRDAALFRHNLVRLSDNLDDQRDNVMGIAREAARTSARDYYEDEIGRDVPMPFPFCARLVASDIAHAMSEAGWTWNTLSADERIQMATCALRDAGYPEDQQDDPAVSIIVNGRAKEVAANRLSYADLVSLAVGADARGLFTIIYSRGPEANPEGSVRRHETVEVTSGMIFSVALTTHA